MCCTKLLRDGDYMTQCLYVNIRGYDCYSMCCVLLYEIVTIYILFMSCIKLSETETFIQCLVSNHKYHLI